MFRDVISLEEMHVTRRIAVNAEVAEVFRNVVPIGLLQQTNPILHIEHLPELLREEACLFYERTAHHHEARLSNEVRREPALEPPLEEHPTGVPPRCKEIFTKITQSFIAVRRLQCLCTDVPVRTRNEADLRILQKYRRRPFEVLRMPKIILEEVLKKMGDMHCSLPRRGRVRERGSDAEKMTTCIVTPLTDPLTLSLSHWERAFL